MPDPVVSAWIAAGAAVLAAVIGPLVSLYILKRQNEAAATIARMQINASLVSTSRQAWIDKLRDSIAEFQSLLWILGGSVVDRSDREEEQRRQQALFLRSRISLLVNPAEVDHKQLLELLERALNLSLAPGEDAWKELTATQDKITRVAQGLLKREWVRVKQGEPTGTLAESTEKQLPRGTA